MSLLLCMKKKKKKKKLGIWLLLFSSIELWSYVGELRVTLSCEESAGGRLAHVEKGGEYWG